MKKLSFFHTPFCIQKETLFSTLFLKKRFCFPDNNPTQCEQCDHIWQSHQSVENISDRPHSADGHIWSDKYCKNINPAVDFHMF